VFLLWVILLQETFLSAPFFGYNLMDVDQGVKYEYHKKSYSRKRGGFLLQVSEMCWVDKCIWNFKGRLTWLSVLLCTMFFFQCWSNEMSIATCALTKLELVITISFGGWWPREWWKTWIWGVSRGVFLAPQSVYVWVFVFWLSVTILVSWESTFDIESFEGILVYVKV
jgi:hypothetical protein